MTALLFLLLAAPPDPVEVSVQHLAAKSFRVRQRARRELHALGFRAIPHLRQAARQAADLEVRRALQGVIEQLQAERRRWAIATVQRRYGDCLPMIDAYWLDVTTGGYDPNSHTSIRRFLAWQKLRPYLDAARQQEGDNRRWAQWRVATEAWFVDLLEAGWPVLLLDVLYLDMRWRDNVWIGSAHPERLDPWTWPGVLPPPACPRWESSQLWPTPF